MIYKIKRFSKEQLIKLKGTGLTGINSNRNYDQDLNRLQKGNTQRQLNTPNILNKELKLTTLNLSKEKDKLKSPNIFNKEMNELKSGMKNLRGK